MTSPKLSPARFDGSAAEPRDRRDSGQPGEAIGLRPTSIVLFLILLLWLQPLSVWAQARAADWQPARTWALVVGVLEWQRRDVWVSFPKTNRRDVRLVGGLRENGVPPERIYYLSDRDATHQAVAAALNDVTSKCQPGDTLIVYYAGHGYRHEPDGSFWMVPYDGFDMSTLWGMAEIESAITKRFRGSRVLLAADCCYSGGLRRFVRRANGKLGLAALSSSTARLTSTGNWTFSDCLIDALAGDPRMDTDHDGWISLAEVAAQIELDMQFCEGQQAGGSGSTAFPLTTRWVPVSRPRRDGEGEFAEVLYGSSLWKARVLDRGPRGVLVRWIGLPQDYPDEWVPEQTVRPVAVTAPARTPRRPRPAAATTPPPASGVNVPDVLR